jgi:hypothetical protein
VTPSNVFVSRPTTIDQRFESVYTQFDKFLASSKIVPRRLGKTDYSRTAPLKAVFKIMDECCGAIILGYPQISMRHEVMRSTKLQNDWGYVFPTPWNQIEGALAYRAGTPVLVVAHPGVEGGVFDHGVTGEGVLHLDLGDPRWFKSAEFKQPFTEWLDEIRGCNSRKKKWP